MNGGFIMRHIKKITLAALLAVQVSSSPVQGMSYLSTAWNSASSLLGKAKNLLPATAVNSVLNKIPGAQTAAQAVSKIFTGTSNVVSRYAQNEAGLINPADLLINLTPTILYGLRNPICRILSRATMNKVSPEFFNKFLIATTTPISLTIRMYSLYLLLTNPLNIYSIWQFIKNIDLLTCEIEALCKFNLLLLPGELTSREKLMVIMTGLINRLLNPMKKDHNIDEYNKLWLLTCSSVYSYLITNQYYQNLGLSNGYEIIKIKMKSGFRKLKEFLKPPIRHNRAIADLGDRTTCGICFEDFARGEHGSSLVCNHHYHTDCINSWLDRNPKCPFCQAPVIENQIQHVTFS